MAFALFVFSNLGFNSVAVLYLKLAQNFTNQDVGLYVALQNGVRPLAPLMLVGLPSSLPAMWPLLPCVWCLWV